MIKLRIKAFIIDTIYFIVVSLLSMLIVWGLLKLLGLYEVNNLLIKFIKNIISWITFLILMWFFIGSVSFKGEGSIGKQIYGLKVISTFGKNTSFRMFLRNFVFKHLSTMWIWLGPILYLFGKEHFANLFMYFVISFIITIINLVIFLITKNFAHDNLLYLKVIKE